MKDLSAALPGTLIASFALAVAATGTAGALAGKNNVDKDDLQKNVVQSKHVKNGSLKGADLKKDSLTGKQVKESSLGTVPRAASVDALKFFDISLVEGQSQAMLRHGSLAVIASCVADGTDTLARTVAETTQAGAAFAGDDESGLLEPSTPGDDRDFDSAYDQPGDTADTSDGYDDQFWLHAANGQAVYGTVGMVVNADTGSCQFFGTYVVR